jgi:hypothetical protein
MYSMSSSFGQESRTVKPSRQEMYPPSVQRMNKTQPSGSDVGYPPAPSNSTSRSSLLSGTGGTPDGTDSFVKKPTPVRSRLTTQAAANCMRTTSIPFTGRDRMTSMTALSNLLKSIFCPRRATRGRAPHVLLCARSYSGSRKRESPKCIVQWLTAYGRILRIHLCTRGQPKSRMICGLASASWWIRRDRRRPCHAPVLPVGSWVEKGDRYHETP